MVKRKNILPYLTIGTLIYDATGKRVSRDAREVGSDILEEVAEKIIRKAVLIAENSNRKTVKDKDIQLAYNQIKNTL